MIMIACIVAVVAVQIYAPMWVSVVVAIANVFVPDMVPVIDEVLGIVIVVLRIKSKK